MGRLVLRRIRHKKERLRHLSKTFIKGTMGGVPEKRTGLIADFTGAVMRSPTDKGITQTFDIGLDGAASDQASAVLLFDDTDDERAAKIATALDLLTGCAAAAVTNKVTVTPTNGLNALSFVTRYV